MEECLVYDQLPWLHQCPVLDLYRKSEIRIVPQTVVDNLASYFQEVITSLSISKLRDTFCSSRQSLSHDMLRSQFWEGQKQALCAI